MLPRKKSRVEWGLSFVAMALAAAVGFYVDGRAATATRADGAPAVRAAEAAAAPVPDPAHVARAGAGSKASGPAPCRPRVSGGGAVPRIPG